MFEVAFGLQVRTDQLLAARTQTDTKEDVFQTSFDEFCQDHLKLRTEREIAVTERGQFRGRIDHIVDQCMAVEMLIRASADNKLNATEILTGATRRSLIEHAARADSKTAAMRGQSSYEQVANQCGNNYVTVLPATVTTMTADTEYARFKTLIEELRKKKADAPILKHKILVAVATFGWGKWDVFLHDPESGCVRFEIKRQRLMYKVIDGRAVLARHYYPKPAEVWVQRLE